MISITLCMIVRNEELTLSRCLDSIASLVDEIIIVDTGSTDKTKEIAESFGASIFEYEWNNNFSDARNFSFKQATKEYVLWLDADDVVSKKEYEKLKNLKNSLDPNVDSVVMNYNLSFDSNGSPNFVSKRNRLVKRINFFKWMGSVHEYLAVSGNIIYSNLAIDHHPLKDSKDLYRNLMMFLKQMESNQPLSTRDLLYFANELYDLKLFDLALVYYQKFTQAPDGWKEDKLSAWFRIADCYEEKNQLDLAIQSLLKTVLLDKPRPEFSCRMAHFLLEDQQFETAVYWYQQALLYSYPKNHLGFINNSYSTWLPHLQLSVCYDRLGDKENAMLHHEKAYTIFPDHPVISSNQDYFTSS